MEQQKGGEQELEESSEEAKRRPLSHRSSAQQRTFRVPLPVSRSVWALKTRHVSQPRVE